MARSPGPAFDHPILIAVSAMDRLNISPGEWADRLFPGGVDLIQLREPDRSDTDLLEIAQAVIGDRSPGCVQINGRPAVARQLRCGVHVPERFDWAVVSERPLSRSVHSLEDAKRSVGPDFVLAGHVFATPSHEGESGRGLEWLREVAVASPVPVVAIGGIDESNAGACIEAGAAGVAVIRALTDAVDHQAAARKLRNALDRAIQSNGEDDMSEASNETIDITLNGKALELKAGSTIADLLRQRELVDRLVVVEINGAIVPRSDFPAVIFNEGDVVEMVHFVGGG